MIYLLSNYEYKFLIILLLIISIKSNESSNKNPFYIKEFNIEYYQNFIKNVYKNYLSRKEVIKEEINNCLIKNCLKCSENGECIECRETFHLDKKKCYSTECSIFGFCKYCDEYDCYACLNGYQLLYGICDTLDKETKKKRIISFSIISGVISILLIVLIILYIFLKKKNKQKNKDNYISDKIIKKKHPKSGNYLIVLPIKDESINNNSIINNNNVSSIDKTTISYSLRREKLRENKCILCKNKHIFCFADCGCSLCYDHYCSIKDNELNLNCPIHKIPLKKSFYIQLEKKSSLKGNAIEQLGQSLCPICKIYPANQSFNCGCHMKLCSKCFNDNVFVFKYNQCPGCGKPYNPK